MDFNENSPLLITSTNLYRRPTSKKGLSIFFAVICIIDVFGVFPIVALPRAIIQCGWFGIALVGTLFLIQMYTAIILGKCWLIAEFLNKNINAKNRYPYTALAEMTYGNYTAKIVTILLDVTVFGAGIPNIIVAAQNLQLVGLRMSDDYFNFSFCMWMLILGIILCPILWIGSPKDIKALCFLSVTVVFSISILIWICIYNDDSINTEIIVSEKSLFQNIISAYGIIAFQFDIHPVLLTIQVDMKDKSKITCTVFYAFLVTTCLFSLTTVFAAFKYGTNTYPNILEGLPPSLILYIAVLLVTMQLCMTSAISNTTLYQHIEDYLNISRDFNYKRCILRSILTAFAVIVAESVPKFELVMSLIGGTLTGPLVFIFPPLFYMKLLRLKKQHVSNLSLQTANHFMYHCETNFMTDSICTDECIITAIQKDHDDENYCLAFILSTFVIIFGIFATCITTYVNISDFITVAAFSPPCLYNLTMGI